jgi:hypothetical protein
MIIKSDVGHLPASLQPQFSAGVGRSHQLWRIAQQGLKSDDLEARIEFHACTGLETTSVRQFKLQIADTDPLALRFTELATKHQLAKTRVFEILVKLGWDSLQAYAARIGESTVTTPPTPRVAVPGNNAKTTNVAMEPAEVQATNQASTVVTEPNFSETPEFTAIANNMLASFGIDLSGGAEQANSVLSGAETSLP